MFIALTAEIATLRIIIFDKTKLTIDKYQLFINSLWKSLDRM